MWINYWRLYASKGTIWMSHSDYGVAKNKKLTQWIGGN